MNGNWVVFDSNVIIFFSKRELDIDELFLKYSELYVSVVTYIEVYSYEFEENEEKHWSIAFSAMSKSSTWIEKLPTKQ